MPDRLVPLEGTLNFRDLGGYRAADGTTRWGVAYRADKLSGLTEADLVELEARGIRHVCDFRYPREIELDPSRLPVGVTSAHLPVGAELADTARTIEDRIRDGELRSVTAEQVAAGYVVMLAERAELFASVVRTVADESRHSVVVHCTAGKDRTGLASALLLGAVGVSDEDIVADYALTDRYRSEARLAEVTPRLEAWGVDPDSVRPLFTSPAETMEVTLAAVAEEWGGVVGYLTGPAGLDRSVLDDLARVFVE